MWSAPSVSIQGHHFLDLRILDLVEGTRHGRRKPPRPAICVVVDLGREHVFDEFEGQILVRALGVDDQALAAAVTGEVHAVRRDGRNL